MTLSQQCWGKEGFRHRPPTPIWAGSMTSPSPHPHCLHYLTWQSPQLVPSCPEGEISKTIDLIVQSTLQESDQALNLNWVQTLHCARSRETKETEDILSSYLAPAIHNLWRCLGHHVPFLRVGTRGPTSWTVMRLRWDAALARSTN